MSRPRFNASSIRALSAVGTAVALTVTLAACGSGSTTGSVTPPTSGPTSGPTTSSTPESTMTLKEYSPAGDIPDDQVFVPYSPPGAGYQITVPEGWSRSTVGRAVTFTDKLNSVRVESVQAPAAPTIQSAQANEVPSIASTATRYAAGDVTTVQRQAGTAVLITYQADAAPDPVTGKFVRDAVERYEFWRNGTEAVLTLSGPVGADNVDPWQIVSDSFTWK